MSAEARTTIRRADLAARIAKARVIPKRTARTAVDTFFAAVAEALARHERTALPGLGAFRTRRRAPRVGRDVNRGTPVSIPERTLPEFRAFRALRESTWPAAARRRKETEEGASMGAGRAERDTGEAQEILPETEKPVDSLEDAYQAGLSYASRGQYEKAAVVYRNILARDPADVTARNALGLAYEQLGDLAGAIREYERVVAAHPDSVEARQNLGAAYAARGMYAEAEAEFRRALELEPDNPGAVYNLGIAYVKRGLYARAAQELERAVALDRSWPEALYYLADALDQLGEHDRAISLYEEVLALTPDNRRVYWRLGVLYDKKKLGDKARAMYRKAVQLSSSSEV